MAKTPQTSAGLECSLLGSPVSNETLESNPQCQPRWLLLDTRSDILLGQRRVGRLSPGAGTWLTCALGSSELSPS